VQDAFHDNHRRATGDTSGQIQGGGGGVAGERTTSSLIIPSGELDQNAHSRSVTFDPHPRRLHTVYLLRRWESDRPWDPAT